MLLQVCSLVLLKLASQLRNLLLTFLDLGLQLAHSGLRDASQLHAAWQIRNLSKEDALSVTYHVIVTHKERARAFRVLSCRTWRDDDGLRTSMISLHTGLTQYKGELLT
jgi:hypothetical protein